MRVKAIKLINQSFKDAKDIKVGMAKPGSDGKVTAKRVIDLVPHMQAASMKFMTVVNDDLSAIEENIPASSFTADKTVAQLNKDPKVKKETKEYRTNYNQSNGQAIIEYQEKTEKKMALYRYDTVIPAGKNTIQASYSDNKPKAKELREVVQLSHVRNYGYLKQNVKANDEFILQLDRNNAKIYYSPLYAKLVL